MRCHFDLCALERGVWFCLRETKNTMILVLKVNCLDSFSGIQHRTEREIKWQDQVRPELISNPIQLTVNVRSNRGQGMNDCLSALCVLVAKEVPPRRKIIDGMTPNRFTQSAVTNSWLEDFNRSMYNRFKSLSVMNKHNFFWQIIKRRLRSPESWMRQKKRL